MFVGDSKGRVFGYTMRDDGGSIEHWVKDEEQERCTGCDADFTTFLRKHHCRNCGNIFCGK